MSWYENHVEPAFGAETADYQGPAVTSSAKSAFSNPLTWVLLVTGGIFAGTLLMRKGEKKSEGSSEDRVTVRQAQVFRIEPGLTHAAAAARGHELSEHSYRGVTYNPDTGLLVLV